MAGLTYTKLHESVLGKHRMVIVDLALDNSYGAGGYAVSAAALGLRKIVGGMYLGGVPGAKVLYFHYDTTNNKIIAVFPTGGAAATALGDPAAAAPGNGTLAVTTTPDAGVTNLTGSAAKPALAGVVSGALAAPALTSGQGKEVGATTDLSTLTVRFMFLGES